MTPPLNGRGIVYCVIDTSAVRIPRNPITNAQRQRSVISQLLLLTLTNAKDNWELYSTRFATAQARHLEELGSKINALELCALASKLRGGIGCFVDLSHKSLAKRMGNQNCHAEIVFDDNVRWL